MTRNLHLQKLIREWEGIAFSKASVTGLDDYYKISIKLAKYVRNNKNRIIVRSDK